MKKHISILILSLFTLFCNGQDYKAQFEQFFQEGDAKKQFEALTKWELEDPENPELYTSFFNYYFYKSKEEVLSMSTEQPEGESLELQDSTGNSAGYLGSEIVFNVDTLTKGLEKIDSGITKYPNRLDMRFGKIYVLGQVEDWGNFTQEIVNTIQFSNTNNNEWTWTFNEKKENGQDFFLSSLQDYQLTLYDTGDDSLLVNMRTIAEEILKYYPKHIESLSNISITYLLTEQYDLGIETLKKAEKIDPTDGIVLSNIAHGYKLKGEIENARKYYEKMLNLEDSNSVEFAKQQLEQLKNQ